MNNTGTVLHRQRLVLGHIPHDKKIFSDHNSVGEELTEEFCEDLGEAVDTFIDEELRADLPADLPEELCASRPFSPNRVKICAFSSD